MKIRCFCNHIIVDQTDFLPNKAHLISDTRWFDFWEAIDAALEKPGRTAADLEALAMQLRMQPVFKTAWECTQCGRLYIEGKDRQLRCYGPEPAGYQGILDGQ